MTLTVPTTIYDYNFNYNTFCNERTLLVKNIKIAVRAEHKHNPKKFGTIFF